MPAAAYNVGRDVALTIFTTDGGILATAGLTSFESKPMHAEIKNVLIDGIMRPAYLPEGWQGTFKVTRQDSGLDDYFGALENNYYNGSDLPSGTITETITNVDGTISQYSYQGVALKLEDAGSWMGNKEVEQSIAFMASRRIVVLP